MKEHLLRFQYKQKYLVFDYETCGLNLGSLDNKPWQLAFLLCEGKAIIERHNFWLHWPELKVSRDAARITGWTNAKYNKLAVDPKKPLALFEKYLYNDDYIKVGHNLLGFDVYIHNINRQLLEKSSDYSYLNRLVDTNCIAKAVKMEIGLNDNEDLLSWQYRMSDIRQKGIKTNLRQLCRDYEIDFDPAKMHDALYDIEKNFEVFQKLIWAFEI